MMNYILATHKVKKGETNSSIEMSIEQEEKFKTLSIYTELMEFRSAIRTVKDGVVTFSFTLDDKNYHLWRDTITRAYLEITNPNADSETEQA